MQNMGDVLMALVSINRRYIRLDRERVALGHAEQIPLLYESGVRYDRLEPEGEACGDDDFQDVVTILEHPDHPMLGDCFPQGSLLLREDGELTPIDAIRVGDKIWGRDAWTTVLAKVFKGTLAVDAADLSNGSVLTVTGDHHVYVFRCTRHADEARCFCDVDQRTIVRARLREVDEGAVLVQPRELPCPPINQLHAAWRGAGRLLRVDGVRRAVAAEPCYDLQTSDHYVYLPEHDVTVSNCDDLACWRVAELNERMGVAAVPYIRLHADLIRDVNDGNVRPRHLYHILVRWPEGLASYPDTVYVDPDTGAYLEDPSAILGMTGDG